jgi:hypothetical protein
MAVCTDMTKLISRSLDARKIVMQFEQKRMARKDARLQLRGLCGLDSILRVESALQAIGGVDRVFISVRERCARVRFDPVEVSAEQLRVAARAVGCEVESILISDAPEAAAEPSRSREHAQACVLRDPVAHDAQPALVSGPVSPEAPPG